MPAIDQPVTKEKGGTNAMGYFSDIVSSVSSVSGARRAPVPACPAPAAAASPAACPVPGPVPADAAAVPAPVPAPVPVPVPDQAHTHVTEPEPTPASVPDPVPDPEPPELKLDAVPDAAPAPDDDARRKAHEAAEAKRKAEFDAKQAEKKAARQAQLDRIAAMSAAELLAASVKRVAADTEKLTRRNMKEAVAEHVQAKCRENAAFAMLVMDPMKSMANCFRYINRQAQKYAEQEMKDQGIQRTGVYGLDVPDGLCYQWAEDYFRDENAEEDHKDDEKFIPKPYVPAAPANRKKAQGKAAKDKKPAPAPKPEKPADAVMEQISLM